MIPTKLFFHPPQQSFIIYSLPEQVPQPHPNKHTQYFVITNRHEVRNLSERHSACRCPPGRIGSCRISDGAEGHFNRRLPAGGNGNGNGNGNGGGNGNGKPGADDEIDVIVKWKNTSVSTAQLFWSFSACMRRSSSW